MEVWDSSREPFEHASVGCEPVRDHRLKGGEGRRVVDDEQDVDHPVRRLLEDLRDGDLGVTGSAAARVTGWWAEAPHREEGGADRQ